MAIESLPIQAGDWGPLNQWLLQIVSALPDVVTSITRDTNNRVTAWTDASGSYTATYSATTGLAATVSNGTTTRTISRDSFGRVTGVA